jgi:Ca2+/H+ antiporter
MPLHLFAGAVISNEQYYSLIAGATVIVVAILSLIIFAIRKYVVSKKTSHNRQELKTSLLISMILIFVSAMLLFVIPTMLEDHQWRQKQADCAKETGYDTPDDNNNPNKATYYTQSFYRECLDN